MSWIDWGIIVVAVIGLRYVSMSTRSSMKGVADFLSANRLAGRYLIAVASAMGGMGTISVVAMFEAYSQAGFTPLWWEFLRTPILIVMLLCGWVYWRFRETRALTMAQFFEMRYSRRFRVFAGFLCWACGVLNFGIFPAVAANFFIYFCGLPTVFHLPGIPYAISTFAVVMALDLGIALIFVTMGGQISVMITECVQGMMTMAAFLIIVAALVVILDWSEIVAALNMAPADASMLNPYHTTKVPDFNIWFYLIGIFGAFYGQMMWQGTQGFYSAAKSPHEQRMAGVISGWRQMPVTLALIMLPLAALTILKLPQFADKVAIVNQTLATISNQAVQDQMRIPVVLAHILPIGVKGLMAMCMLFFSFTCHDTYMHSWGSIFIQDVVLPVRTMFRKPPLLPRQHINWLRGSIIFVAIFAFFFSIYYIQTAKILMFFAVTGTIWAGGAGAVIIGGLYWKRGTTAAAYSALILGAVMGVGGLFINNLWQALYGHNFPINGQVLWFLAMVSAIVVYAVVSLITGSKATDIDMEKMLHRGKYALASDPPKPKVTGRSKLLELVGISSKYTFTDKILAVALVVWNFGWAAAFLAGTLFHFTVGLSDAWWASFWHFYVILLFGISVPATIWFTVGGCLDIRSLFKTLATAKRDHTDDGRVTHEAEQKTEKIAGETSPQEPGADPEISAAKSNE